VWYRFWKTLLWITFRLGFGLRVEGGEHEPRTGAVLAICNHVSAVDPPIAGCVLRRKARYMAKQELVDTPVLGWLLWSVGVYPVRRGEPDRRAIKTTLECLNRGEMVMMFPEGTRSPDGRLMRAEPGAALVALRVGVTVLPMAVIGSQHAMPKGAKLPRRAQVAVKIGPPLAVPKIEGRIDRATLEAWGERFMAAIAALLPPEQQSLPEVRAAVTAASPPSAGS
jgi:1-acyl-sn-glycerol-3-phosphate acyltransferase